VNSYLFVANHIPPRYNALNNCITTRKNTCWEIT